jgi:hypothetical protein
MLFWVVVGTTLKLLASLSIIIKHDFVFHTHLCVSCFFIMGFVCLVSPSPVSLPFNTGAEGQETIILLTF